MQRIAASLLLALLAAQACNRFEEGSLGSAEQPRDAGTDDDGGTGSSDAAVGDGSSFVPQTVPEWRPSWAEDTELDDVTADIAADCPEFPVTGGALSGTYRFTQVCFSDTKFRAPFEPTCPGIRVNNGKAKARVRGSIHAESGQLTRRGTLFTAAEIVAPCRGQAEELGATDACGSIGALVEFQLKNEQPEADVSLLCYDTAPAECTCHLEIIRPFSPDPVGIDSSAGTFDHGEYKYGLSGNTLRYTGVGVRSFDLNPAMTWTLTAE